MELFLDDPRGLPKLAAAFTRLSENPDDWQMEILNELYRQAPYLGDFDPKLIMQELDAERRYALGSVELKNKQAVNPRDDKSSAQVQGVNSLKVPVIVRDGKMSPLDVFLHKGKAFPLTERRVRRALFRPQLFEAADKRPGDQDMMNVLYPPYRSGGFGLGGNTRVGTHETAKTGSAKPHLLDVIHHTVKEADRHRFEDLLNKDHTLQAAVIANPGTFSFVQKLGSPIEQVSGKDMIKTAMQSIPPKVVQIKSDGQGMFLVKTANPDTLLPEENKVDRPTATKMVGKDLVRQVERDGTVTVSTDSVVKDSLADAHLKVVDRFGQYKVKTKDGKELIGWAFPRCVDLDGTNLGLAIFTNGSQSAFQENIAGSPAGKDTNLIDEDPSGTGCFYLARQGGATAIVPMEILGKVQDTDGQKKYHVKTVMGSECMVHKVPGLAKVADLGNNKYGIPADCGWMPLPNMTSLAEDPNEYVKVAEARSLQNQVEVMYNGTDYSMRGIGLKKLAHVLPVQFIGEDQAMFNLAILGLEPMFAKEKLAAAKKLSQWNAIDDVRQITLATEKYARAKTAAAKWIAHLNEKMPEAKALLVKEAATLEDPLSVDKVLSVGFINPENIGTFISYLPEFEDTLSKLSELLVASRVGLKSVDTGALERVVKHLDKVISGLREMSQHPQA